MNRVIILLIVFIIPISLFTQNISTSSRLVSKETTRKIAKIQCQSTFGNFPIYDELSYKDVDGERSCDVYIFSKTNKWENKSSLIDSIYYYRKVLFYYGDSIKNINTYFPSEKQGEKLYEFRKQTNKYIKLSTRPHEFISIYTSPSQNHKPVMEYREGLPESIVMKYDIIKELLNKGFTFNKEISFYYFGPLNLFYSPNDEILISANDNSFIINKNDIIDDKFNYLTLQENIIDNLNIAWESVNKIKDIANIVPDNTKSSHIIPNVPNFRQMDWSNICTGGGSCVVMSTGSALGYYDQSGYWSICPFAWYEGTSNANGGFGFFPGKSFWGSQCHNDVHFGPETMLYNIAVEVGYDFVNGGTNVGCMLDKISTHCNNYTDDYLGLSFNYDQDCGGWWGGHSYNEIKNEINANKPMLMAINYYSWGSSGGPYFEQDYHQIAIISYDENYWVGGDPIGVYINGNSSWGIVWWDYDQIRSQNSEITCTATSGGSCGTWINAPSAYSPTGTVPPGNINFSWQNVNASLYRVQISSSSNFSSYIYTFTTTNTSSTKTITPPGTYYWRVVPKNSDGNWCHFNSTVTFQVEEEPEITLSPTSHDFGEITVGDCSSEYSFTLKNIGGGTATGSVSVSGSNANQFVITSGSDNFSLSQNQTKTIKVKFCPTSTGYKSANLYANGSNCNNASSSISGTVVQPPPDPEITLTPSSHNYGEVYVDDCSNDYSFILENIGGGTATGNISLTGSNANQFYVTSGSGSFSLSQNQTKTIKVKFCPTSTGNKSANLYANGSNCNNASSSISGTGVLQPQPQITLTPASHDFDSIQVGSSSSEYSFTLKNDGTGTATGTVSLTGSNVDQFEITSGNGSFSLSQNQTKTINVKFKPTSEGDKTATLFANGESPCNDASSSLSGTGVLQPQPQITLTPASHDFDSIQVGSSSSEYSFTLKNDGTGTATGTVSLTGSNVDQFEITSGNGSFSLSQNQTKTINVKFKPTSEGDKTATLFADGNPPCNDASSPISGTGIVSTLDPPTNLQAIVNDDDVHLTWDAPGGNQLEWLSYNDGTFEDALCSTNGGSGIAQLFTISEPCTIKKIRFFVSSYGSYNQEIEVNILSGNGTTVLSGPHIVNGVADDWITIDINDIYVTNNFMVSTFNVQPGGPYIGADDSFYNGTLYFGTIGDFTELGQLGYEYVGSHEAYVQYDSKTFLTKIPNKDIKPIKSNIDFSNIILLANTNKTKKRSKNNNQHLKGLLGYNIYRNGNKINSSTITNTYYDDNNLPNGTYNYYVTAIYDEGESGASNIQTINISVGEPPEIALSPTSHDFGEITVGNCSSEYLFTLKNIGGGTATGSVSLTGSDVNQFEITSGSGSFSLSQNQTKTIKVKFCPTSTGNKSANLYANGSNCNNASSSLSGTVSTLDPPTNLQATVNDNDVHLIWEAPSSNGFEEDFETYEDFVLEFTPWTNIDFDGSNTYGIVEITWPNVGDPQAFILFNPSATTPPITSMIPHSGSKLAACFAATAPPNNDWLITPKISIEAGTTVDFWAKSFTNQYGLERFNVEVSTTGINPSDFTIISPAPYVEPSANDWEEFSYDLSSYAGKNIYIAIQCVSNDAFILLIDDFYVGTDKSSIVYNKTKPIMGTAIKDFSPVSENHIKQTPNSNKKEKSLLGYNIYRNGNKINSSTITNTYYDDNNLPNGTYNYYVTAIYDEGESGASNIQTINISVGGPPEITLSPTSHDFGEIIVGNCSSEYSFTLKNIGGGTATGSVSLSGSNVDQFEITSGSGSFSLSQNQTKTINVKFKPTSVGNKSANLYANGSNCNNASSSLSGKGITNPSLTVSPTTITLSGYSGSSSSFDIISNISWQITGYPSWLDLSSISGSNDATINVTANSENTYESERSAILTISETGGFPTQNLTVTQESTYGIDDETIEKLIKIYPNPTSLQLNVKFQNIFINDVSIIIYDIHGNILDQKHFSKLPSKIIQLNLSNYANGVYYINIQTSKETITKKITVLH